MATSSSIHAHFYGEGLQMEEIPSVDIRATESSSEALPAMSGGLQSGRRTGLLV